MLEHTIDYPDLTDAWTAIVDGKSALKSRGAVMALREDNPGFTGATNDDMRERVTVGWTVPGTEVKPARSSRPRRKMRYAEEGDLQVDLALSGHDFPFLEWSKRKRPGGLKLQIELGARANVTSATLAAYAGWVARLIAGLQDRGVDLEISVFSTSALSVVESEREILTTRVRVKRFGKRSSLKSWGAIFSPSGFRMLIFAGRIMACEAHGKTCSPGFGGSLGKAYDVKFDDGVLTVHCNATGGVFPAASMDAKLKALGF